MTFYSSADEQVLLDIRKTIIVSIASDDVLMERLVLKGGNALDVVYKLTERSSLDVDFSMAHDLESEDEFEEMKSRLFRALHDRFDSLGYVVFDERFVERPLPKAGQASGVGITLWGGYNAEFKLVRKDIDRQLRDDLSIRTRKKLGREPNPEQFLQARRTQSQVTGAGSGRVFTIEISKFEYTEGRVIRNVDNFDCYVYTPAMIAVEKLRAICQQLPQYEFRKNPTPRPRDFFDIHTIATRTDCDVAAAEHHPLVRNMFSAKAVPLELLRELGANDVRTFHSQQWNSVKNAVRGSTHPFDYYFDFVVSVALRLSDAMALSAHSIP